MDEGRHRGGARHGVGQPDVEGNLGALPRGSQEEEQRHRRDEAPAVERRRVRRRGAEHPGEVQGAEGGEQQEHGDQEAEVPDAVHDERLLARVGVRAVGEPEADEEVAAQPHPLPAHEQDGEARAHDEHEHEEHEQVQVGEVAWVAGVVLHVAHAEHVDEEADPRHHQHHDHGELVELHGGAHPEGARHQPLPVLHHHRRLEIGPEHAAEVHQHDGEGRQQHPRPDPRGEAVGQRPLPGGHVQLPALPHRVGAPARVYQRQDAVRQEAQEGQQDHEPGEEGPEAPAAAFHRLARGLLRRHRQGRQRGRQHGEGRHGATTSGG